MSAANIISLAVWDTSLPVVAGETFAIKVGAKATDARALAGCRIAVSDTSGTVVASGVFGDAPWPGTEALYWTALSVPAPTVPHITAYQVRLADAPAEAEAPATEFTVVAAAKPAHSVAVKITERIRQSRSPMWKCGLAPSMPAPTATAAPSCVCAKAIFR